MTVVGYELRQNTRTTLCIKMKFSNISKLILAFSAKICLYSFSDAQVALLKLQQGAQTTKARQ